jgi:excisionase family DNA binding protein
MEATAWWVPILLETKAMPRPDPKPPAPPLHKPTRLLTPSEAAAFLSVSPRTLTRLTAMGDLPHTRIGGQRRYELEALLAYVARQRRGG